MQQKVSQKFYIIIVLVLTLAFASKAFASLTFTTNAITGTTASTVDVGAGNALSLQTTNNGAITTGSGLVTLGGNLVVTGTLNVASCTGCGGAGSQTPWTANVNADGFTLYGNDGANDDLTLEGTSHATKTTSYIIMQPTGGNVGIGLITPAQKLDVAGKIALNGVTVAYMPTAFYGTLVLGNGGTNLLDLGSESEGGYYNTFVGMDAGTTNTTGNYNVAVGEEALYYNTDGTANIAVGLASLFTNISGGHNTSVGQQAMYYNTASNNTALGDNALYSITSGANNVGIGFFAGRWIANGSTANQTSGTSVYLGASTKSLASGDANEIVIGYNAIGLGSNTAVLGNSSITTTALRGNVGIGTTTPNANAILDVTSTTKAFMPPRMTTTQRDAISSPTAGMVIYNSSTNKLNVYTTTWEAVTSS